MGVLLRAAGLGVLVILAVGQWVWASPPNGGADPARPVIALFRDAAIGGPESAAVADAAGEALTAAHLKFDILDGRALTDPTQFNPGRYELLVYSGGRGYPQAAARLVDAFLTAGRSVLALGGPPFSQPTWLLDGRWVGEAELPRIAMATQGRRTLLDFRDPKQARSWSRASNSGGGSRVLVEDSGSPQGDSLTVDIKGLTGWDTFTRAVEGIPTTHSALCFYARGDAATTQMIVELQEEDGSRWIGVARLGTEWRPSLLRAADFRFWPDPKVPGRGDEGDQVRFHGVRKLSIGLAFSHTSVTPGDHRFWVDEISTTYDPLASQERTVLIIDTMTPEYKLFPIRTSSEIRASSDQVLLPGGDYPAATSLFSCSPRPQGSGYSKGRKARFIPLLTAHDEQGRRTGYAAWLMICGDAAEASRPGASWAVFAPTEASWYRSPCARTAVGRVARRMLQHTWLYEGGSEHFTYFQDAATVKLGAEVVASIPRDSKLSLRISVRGRSGKLACEKAFRVRPGVEQDLTGTWRPVGFPDGDYTVTTELLEGRKAVDVISHSLTAWNPKPLAQRQFVTSRDGDFWCDGKPWYAHGVNYMPSSCIGVEDVDTVQYWLDGPAYDPAVVEEDLARIQALGFNSVSVFMNHHRSKNLLDLLSRCERHRLKVNLSIRPGADPLAFAPQEVEGMIVDYRLASNDTIYAYDLAWERSWGTYEPCYTNALGRRGYDLEWERWILERYGSLLVAEADWESPVPRTDDGRVTGPSDAMLRGNGPWVRLVAAYRRFVDNFVSKMHSQATQFIKGLDPNHLVSFRMSGDAGDPTADPAQFGYDFRGLAKSMDIMQPEGYGRVGPWERVREGIFTAAYADYAAPGRPVLWAEFGTPAWSGSNFGDPGRYLQAQGAFIEDFYRMSALARADGAAVWWYPGGYRVDEGSDYGIVNPDGSAREATLAVRTWAPILKGNRASGPQMDLWIDVDRDLDVRGIAGIYEKVKGAFWSAIESGANPRLRDAGTGTTSLDTPLLAVGNVPYNGSNPPKFLDAEFNRVQVRSADAAWVSVEDGATVPVATGKPVSVRASVGNLQVAKWIAPRNAGGRPGGVYMTAQEALLPIVSDTQYLQDAHAEGLLSAGVRVATPIVLQMTAQGRMAFGEKMAFTLLPR